MSTRVDNASLTLRQRYQRWVREQLRVTRPHALIGLVVSCVLVFGLDAAYSNVSATQPPSDGSGDDVFSAAFVGDLMFGRHVLETTSRHGADYPLAHVADHLGQYDYVTGNLEQAVLRDSPSDPRYAIADKLIHLATGPEVVDPLVTAGFTHLNVANNHAMDFGPEGLVDTVELLDERGLTVVGGGADLQQASAVHYDEIGPLTVATLGFTDVYTREFPASPFRPGIVTADAAQIGPAVREARANADLVIAHVHWGVEYDWRPDRRQRELGHALADEGVDIVIGHHPHVLLPVEAYGDSLIFYSLGNFVFDQGWTRTRESVIASYTLAPDGTASIELTPVYVRAAQPRVLSGALSRYRQARVFSKLTAGIDGWEREGDRMVLRLDHSRLLGGASGE